MVCPTFLRGYDLYAIWLKEINPPKNAEPIEWMLLSNLEVKTVDQAIERINWYRCRWQIEVFHKILKSGCTIEKCRLETAERLIRYITVMSVIALAYPLDDAHQPPTTQCPRYAHLG